MQSLGFVTLKPAGWMLIGCLVVIVALSAFPFSLINEAESDRTLVYRSSNRFIEKLYSNATTVFYSDLCDKHKIVRNCEVEVKLCFFFLLLWNKIYKSEIVVWFQTPWLGQLWMNEQICLAHGGSRMDPCCVILIGSFYRLFFIILFFF